MISNKNHIYNTKVWHKEFDDQTCYNRHKVYCKTISTSAMCRKADFYVVRKKYHYNWLSTLNKQFCLDSPMMTIVLIKMDTSNYTCSIHEYKDYIFLLFIHFQLSYRPIITNHSLMLYMHFPITPRIVQLQIALT